MARNDHMERTLHVFHYTDYDLIVCGRGRKWSYFFKNTWCVFQSSSESPVPVQIVSNDRWLFDTAASPLWGSSPLTSMESSAAAWGIYLCRPQLLNMPDRSGSAPSQRSISHSGASALVLQKGERLASPVKGYRQPRPAWPSTERWLLL